MPEKGETSSVSTPGTECMDLLSGLSKSFIQQPTTPQALLKPNRPADLVFHNIPNLPMHLNFGMLSEQILSPGGRMMPFSPLPMLKEERTPLSETDESWISHKRRLAGGSPYEADDDRFSRRREMNRIAQQKSRLRKEKQREDLEKENSELRARLSKAEAEVAVWKNMYNQAAERTQDDMVPVDTPSEASTSPMKEKVTPLPSFEEIEKEKDLEREIALLGQNCNSLNSTNLKLTEELLKAQQRLQDQEERLRMFKKRRAEESAQIGTTTVSSLSFDRPPTDVVGRKVSRKRRDVSVTSNMSKLAKFRKSSVLTKVEYKKLLSLLHTEQHTTTSKRVKLEENLTETKSSADTSL